MPGKSFSSSSKPDIFLNLHPIITSETMMETKIQQAVELNNWAAELVLSQRFDEAMQTLKHSLKTTRDLLSSNVVASSGDEIPLGVGRSTQESSLGVPSTNPGMWITDSDTPGGNTFLVYRSPRLIKPIEGTISLNYISTVILFNLALAHHLKALSASEVKFETIVQLYEHTYRIAIQDGVSDAGIVLAILNNLAHAHFKMQSRDNAERICGLLWNTVVEMEKEARQHEFAPSMYEGLYENVVHVTFRCSHTAAAA